MGGDSFQAPAESSECSGLDVEYQVPTSSQRDQEDDIIVVTSEEEEDDDEGPEDDDDEEEVGPDFQPDDDEEDDNDEGYGIETYRDREDRDLALADYDDVEGPDIDDENGGEQDNEVEIIDDSNEVPNQPGSSSSSSGGPSDATPHVGSSATGEQLQSVTATHILPLQQQSPQPQVPQQPQQPQEQQQSSSEATSSGATNQSDNGNSSSSSSSNGGPSGSSNSQVSSQGTPVSLAFVPRSRTTVPPLNRQQLVLVRTLIVNFDWQYFNSDLTMFCHRVMEMTVEMMALFQVLQLSLFLDALMVLEKQSAHLKCPRLAVSLSLMPIRSKLEQVS